MKFLFSIFLLLGFLSCSTIQETAIRTPANEATSSSCVDLAKNILMTDNYEQDLTKVLLERKLITIREKLMLVQYPGLEWINKVKVSFTNSLRNWNSTRYPAFYIFNDEDVVPLAKKYAENIEKIVSDQIPADDAELLQANLAISEWIKTFLGYKTEMDQLIEERISLQYNVNLLKELKLSSNEPRDIQITIKRAGVLKNEIITFRAEDKNLGYTIKKLKKEISDLDESFKSNGKIKERIIRQAMLQDMLTITQRELEYAVKNSASPSEEAVNQLQKLSLLITNSEDPLNSPSTYGVFKITNKVFMRELAAAAKLDVAYQKISSPVVGLKNIVTDYLAPTITPAVAPAENLVTDAVSAPVVGEVEKTGFLGNVYAKISSIAPKSILGGAVVVIGGIGVERYFAIKPGNLTEINTNPTTNVMTAQDQAHQQQLDRTAKVGQSKQDGQSHVVEVQINAITAK